MPDLSPIIRSTIVTCRARQLTASSSCCSSASLTAHTSAYCERSWAAVRSDSRTSSSLSAGRPRWRSTSRNASHRVGSSSRSPQPLLLRLGEPPEPVDVRRVLGAGQELQLAELHRLEAARRRQPLPELQEVLRGHRLQHVDLVHQHPLDHVHPLQQVLGPPQPAIRHRVPRGGRLVEELLEPQLVDLVDGDEEQLVVRRRVGLEVLGVEQLRQPQVAAVGQLRPLLAERDEGLRDAVVCFLTHAANLVGSRAESCPPGTLGPVAAGGGRRGWVSGDHGAASSGS